MIVYHDQHNLQEINNLIQVENLHIQINGVNHNIGLNFFIYFEFKTKKNFVFLPWISPKKETKEYSI